MNKLLQKLANQCRTEYHDRHGDYIEQFDEEKFAEMLIRECLEQVRDEVQYEHDWKLANDVVKRVLEHFGVEEL